MSEQEWPTLGYSVKGNRYEIKATRGEIYEAYTDDQIIELVDRRALAAKDARIAELDGLLEHVQEGSEILKSLIDNIEAKGNYSAEITVNFLRQAHSCLLPVFAGQQQADHSEVVRAMAATPSEDGGEVQNPLTGAFITGESGNGEYRVALKFQTLTDMQAAHNYIAQHQRIVAAKDAALVELINSRNCYQWGFERVSAELEQLRAQSARKVGVDDIACDRAYRNGLISGFNHGINSDEDSFNRSLNAYQREIHQATAELRDAIAPAASKANSGCYVQDVPEHCDRITWRGHYYGLPPLAPVAHQVGGGEREARALFEEMALIADDEKCIQILAAALAPDAVDEIARVKNAAREIRDHLKREVARLESDLEHARKKVLVVMPEKKESRQFDPAGWNAALDEVARLNRNPIPVELLERICNSMTLRALDNAVGELRALLGKEDGGQ